MGEYNAGGSLKTMGLSSFQSPFFSTLSFFSPLYLLPSTSFLVSSISVSLPVSSTLHLLSCLLYPGISACIICLPSPFLSSLSQSLPLYLTLSSAFHPLSCLLYLSLSPCIFCIPSPFLSSLSQSLPLYLLPSIPFLVFSISVSHSVSSASIPFLVFSISVSPSVSPAFHPLSCLLYLSLSSCISCLPSPFLSSLSQSLPLYLLPSIPFLVFSI
jgi:hypothetical protein